MPRDRSAPLLLVKLRPREGEEFRLVTDQVLSFKYTDAERAADVCRLVVDNHDLSNFDDPAWRKGGKLVVQWGYPGAMTPARTCVITSVKGFKELQVEANAESVLMNRVVKCRTFQGKTISQIARDIATENGFGREQQIVDETEEVYETVAQARMTDAQFLRRWASRVGFEFFVDFDGFHFHQRRLGERPLRVFRYHTDPGGGDILGEPRIENDLTARPGRVRVRGRNPMDRSDINEVADNATDADRDTLTEVVELIDPDTGAATTVERALGSEDTVTTADATPQAARRRAQGRFRRAQQVAVKMTLPIVGDPLLFAKSVVQVEGMGRRLSVRYYVTEVEHDLSPGGYTCNVKMVSDGHGGHSTASSRAVGLSAVQAGRGAGRGPQRSPAVVRQLQEGLAAAQSEGNERAAAAFHQALDAYQRGGNRVLPQIQGAMASVATNEGGETGRAAAGLMGISTQQGGETETGGRPNRQEAQEDTGELEPVEFIDPDSGEARTRYRQTGGRGSGTMGAS